MSGLQKIIAAARQRVSPAYLAYKQRVEADGGVVELTLEQMRSYFILIRYAVWMHIMSGHKASKLYTFFPNQSSADISFSRNSKATHYPRLANKMVEADPHKVAVDWSILNNSFTGFNVSPQATNRNTNSASTNYTVSANCIIETYAWNHTNLYTHAIYYGDNSLVRFAGKSTIPPAGDTVLGCFVEMLDGSEPRVGTEMDANADFTINISGGPVQLSANWRIFKRQITSTVWYVAGYTQSSGVSSNNHIRKYTTNSNKPFRVTGYMLEYGVTVPGRHIVTTGAIATKLFDDLTTALILPMNGVIYADMSNYEVMGSTSVPRGFSLRVDASNYITIGYTQAGTIGMAIFQSGAVVMQITSGATSGKMCARFVDGQYSLVVNGIEYSAFTTGSQSIVNPFVNSVDVTIGSSQRNINIRAVAVLNNLTIEEMKILTE